MKRILGYLSVLLLALAVFTSLLPAQTAINGELTGTVTDPQGAVVPNAQVELKSLQTGETKNATTNSSGQYRFSLLKPGGYSATVTAAGFQATTQNASVNLGQVTNLNIKAGLAGTSTSIEVTTEAPLLQSDNANLSTTYNAAQIDHLPAPGGDTTSYAFTAPGVTISTGAGYGNFSAYGLPSNSNLFTTNGNDNMDPYLNLNNSGASNLTLGANELSEVAVVENGYSVQYGRQAGAQVNSVTKGGTNQFHGNASYWYNAGGFNANDWFNNHGVSAAAAAADPTGTLVAKTPRPHAVNNQYAGSFGGHIIKDKLFFFGDYEGLRYVLPGGGAPVFIPTPAFSNFVLGNIGATSPSQLPFYQTILGLYAGASGAGRAAPVPVTASDPGGCGAFVDPVFGVTQPCSMKFQSTNNNLNTETLYSGRIDYNISSSDTIFGRYRHDNGVQATQTDPINSAFNANSIQPEYEGQITETHLFGSTATNQVIISGSWYSAKFGPPNIQKSLSVFPTTLTFADGDLNGLGVESAGFLYPQGRNVTQWMIVDDFSKTHGNHDFKIGMNFRRNDVSSYVAPSNTSGFFTFNDVTDFVNGNLNNGSQFNQNFTRIGQVPIALYSAAVYAQDQWKPRSNLSLTYGLRLDRNANPKCQKNCFTRLNAPFGTASHDSTQPYNSIIRTGLTNAFPNIETISLQPRVGIAYTIRPTTVIRSGIGLFTDLFPATLADRFITNAPNVVNFIATSGNVAPGPGSAADANAQSNAAFQSGFANGATLAQFQTAVPGFTVPNFSTVANRVANPKFVEYNLEVEQAIGRRVSVSLNYVGNYGYDLFNQNAELNAFCKSTVAGHCPFAGIIGTTPADPRFGQILEVNNHGYSNYNGFNPSVKFRLGDFFQGSFSYTWSKAMDTCSNNCLLPFNLNTAPSIRNQLNPVGLGQTNYGPADYDTRHALSANYVLAAPRRVFNNGLLSAIAGGWTLGETVYFHSGYPFSVVNTSVRSRNLGNVTGLRNAVLLSDYLGGAPSSCSTPQASVQNFAPCLSTSSFAASGAQTDFGNLSRNHFRGAGYLNTDVNLNKNFHLGERFVFGLGANAFNILNHPNFDLPVNNRALGNFGQITQSVSAPTSPYGSFTGSAVSGRVLQLNAHVSF